MPRATKREMFSILNAKKSGYWKNKMLLSVNGTYEGGTDNLSLQDLLNFLKEKGVDPAKVALHSNFITYIKVR